MGYCVDRLQALLSGVASKDWVEGTLLKRLDENINVTKDYMSRITSLYALRNVIMYAGDSNIKNKAAQTIKKCLKKDERVPNVKFAAINSFIECYSAIDGNILTDVKKTVKDFED